MNTQDQPLDDQPQDDDFDNAFDDYAGGERDESRDTDRDFAGGEQDEANQDDDGQGDQTADDMTPRERELQSQLERIRHSEASQRGRLGAYQRQINELQRQVQTRQASQPPQRDGQAAEGDDQQQRQEAAEAMGADDWETFKEDFPDMARAFEARLSADRQKQAHLEQEVAELRSSVQPIQQQAQEQHLKDQEDALAARHPDWREVVAAPEFAEWLNQQPDSLQALTSSDDAAEAAALLDMYRAQHGSPEPAGSRTGTPDKRQQRLAAAQSVGRRGAPRQGAVDDDFDAAFDHYAAKRGTR